MTLREVIIHSKFKINRWLYLNTNEFARQCYQRYWDALNELESLYDGGKKDDDDDQTPDAGNPILAV